MKFYLKTKQECDEIVARNEAFIKAEREVEGVNVVMYDYRLASISDFANDEAFELRGLTFIEQPDGTWKRNLLMQKFFNYGQTLGWMPEDLQGKKVARVQNKEDGSVISFVEFPNSKVRAKSKMSFISEQAVMAQNIYDTSREFQHFITECNIRDFTPIFELVGFENQIVLNYEVANALTLLQVRRNDGSYLEKLEMKSLADIFNINVTEDFKIFPNENLALDGLLRLKETSQANIEGWVVTFEDGQMAKIKTDHYIQLHGLVGPDAFRENLLVKTILDGNIDDVIAQLVQGPKKDMIIEMEEKVSHYYNHQVVAFKELRRKYFQDFDENRKEFALKYRNEPLFGGVMKSLNTSFRDVEQTAGKMVKEHIEKQTNSLGKAKEFVEGL